MTVAPSASLAAAFDRGSSVPVPAFSLSEQDPTRQQGSISALLGPGNSIHDLRLSASEAEGAQDLAAAEIDDSVDTSLHRLAGKENWLVQTTTPP